MSAIPIHLQRRFEQRWASRYAASAAASAPKYTRIKAEIPTSTVPDNDLTEPIAVAMLSHDGRAAGYTPRAV
jgi:hypothetical protein